MENILYFFFGKKKNNIWYSCKFCSYHFKYEKDLIKHLWIKHNKGNGKIFYCNRCNKSFRCKDLYNKHLVFHYYWDQHQKKM